MWIEIKKRADGAGVLRCIRDDGSVTWQRQDKHAAFFALHDLMHYAVETTLGYKRGFFGLIAEGWEIDDTTGKGSRGPLPPDAGLVEQVVGLLDAERASGTTWTLEEIREFGGTTVASLTVERIGAIRKRRSDLFEQWAEVRPGEALRLPFPV